MGHNVQVAASVRRIMIGLLAVMLMAALAGCDTVAPVDAG